MFVGVDDAGGDGRFIILYLASVFVIGLDTTTVAVAIAVKSVC